MFGEKSRVGCNIWCWNVWTVWARVQGSGQSVGQAAANPGHLWSSLINPAGLCFWLCSVWPLALAPVSPGPLYNKTVTNPGPEILG